MKKRGSALVIAMLLMAAIGGIAVLFGRLVFLEVRNTTISTNGVLAYYAAESGIEEAFLRYRYNKDQQVPTGAYTAANGFISNLNTKLVVSGTNNAGTTMTSANYSDGVYNSKYWLNIGSTSTSNLGPYSNEDITDSKANISSKFPDYVIERDNTVRVDLGDYFKIPGRTLDMKLRYLDTSMGTVIDSSRKTCAPIEVKIIGQKVDGTTEERKELLVSSDSGCSYPASVLGRSNAHQYSSTAPVNGKYFVILFGIKDIVSPTIQFDNTILVIKNIGLETSLPNYYRDTVVFSLGTFTGGVRHRDISNTVTSKGYFGGSTRTLEAKINRQYGGLQDLFNYVIYRADVN